MKKIFTLLIGIVFSITILNAQVPPQAFSYKATITRTNPGGNIVAIVNKTIGLKIVILQGDPGITAYSETFKPTTNSSGQIDMVIGRNPDASYNFSNIKWSEDIFFLQVCVDINGGVAYGTTPMSTTQLLSVPYALYADKAGSAINETDPVFVAHPAHGITNGNITNWNTAYGWGNHAGLYRPIGYVPAWSEITGKPTTISGYGITDAVTTATDQTITGAKTFTKDAFINGLTVGRGKGSEDYNTAVGYQALFSNTTGGSNTAIGNQALYKNMTGTGNTAIGDYAGVASEDLINSTAIGYGATVAASNKVVIGNSLVNSIGGYADWSNYFDERLKENIIYGSDLGLNLINKLQTVSYNFKADPLKRHRDGLIAQDVDKALKDLGLQFSGLVIDDDKDKTMNLSYGDFVIPLINAVQEQQKQIEAQQKQIDELKKLVIQPL